MKKSEIYRLIKLSKYKRLIKEYEKSEEILKNILKNSKEEISVYLNLGELYFDMENTMLCVKSITLAMHLLIKDKMLKRLGKVEYSSLEKLRDDLFISKLSKNVKKSFPIEECFVVNKDESLCYFIGNIFMNSSCEEDKKLKFGREFFMKNIIWSDILNENVYELYFKNKLVC